MELKTAFEAARKQEDLRLAVFILRDVVPENLKDLVWSMDQASSLHKNDVLFLFELIEKELENV